MVLWPLLPLPGILFGDREEMLEDGHGSLALVSQPGILFGDREEMLENGQGSLALASPTWNPLWGQGRDA